MASMTKILVPALCRCNRADLSETRRLQKRFTGIPLVSNNRGHQASKPLESIPRGHHATTQLVERKRTASPTCPSVLRALNSAVECHIHTVEVIGSNPIAPTIFSTVYRILFFRRGDIR